MSKAEKRIADWLAANPGEIIPLSIVELAEKCECSEATIVRFAKHLGFSGYQGLKISLAQEQGTKIVNDDITGKETCYEIYEKVCNDIYMSLEKTKKSLSADNLAKAADAPTAPWPADAKQTKSEKLWRLPPMFCGRC